MFKKALLFLTANVFFVAIVIGIYAAGYEYDSANKLYLEREDLSYHVSFYVYGKRWERTAKIMLGVGVAIDAVVLLGWLRKREELEASSQKTKIL
ncbi:MAG: hypothetical protein DMF63_14530 [Acidobacteria bacterium]|nr:MAG: hypothetical protein DMF63_14530 [Acidobacteriota bacterium]